MSISLMSLKHTNNIHVDNNSGQPTYFVQSVQKISTDEILISTLKFQNLKLSLTALIRGVAIHRKNFQCKSPPGTPQV